MKKTKIVCTLGPASDTEEIIVEIVKMHHINLILFDKSTDILPAVP